MMDNLDNYLSLLIDYTTLVYHEARNVRHLIHAQAVEPEKWKFLVSLPVNREKSWEALQDTRSKAQRGQNVKSVISPFELRFKVNLDEIQELFENPAWHNAPFGDNAWVDITRKVKRLAVALEYDK